MTEAERQASADLRGARIVIVSVSYWPEDVGIAPYSTATAEHLAACGADVTAIVGIPHYPSWCVQPDDRWRLRRRERRKEIDVRRFRVFVPSEQDALRRASYEASFLLNGGLPGRLGEVDAVIGVIPSLTGGVIAASVARRHHCPLGLVVQDLTGPAAAQSGMRGGGRVARLTSRLEGAILRRAQSVAVVSDGFLPYLKANGVPGCRITTLRNWSRMPLPSSDVDEVRHELGWSSEEPVLLHAGNMGLKQGLEHVIAAAHLAQRTNPRFHFSFMGDGSQRRHLERLSADLPNVSFHGPRYGQDFADALAAADVLLVNERSSVLDMSLPSKLTSYFVAGRPILAAVAEGGVTAQEVERSGAGVTVPAESPEALLGALAKLSIEGTADRYGSAGRRYAMKHLDSRAALRRAGAWASALLNAGNKVQEPSHAR